MFEIKTISLKDNRIVNIRLLQQQDAELLYNYLHNLSAESCSRFGPHPFDTESIFNIGNNLLKDDVQRYIALKDEQIIPYMLLKKGTIKADANRYAQRNTFFDETTAFTYAPSVADDYQNSGLGSKMFAVILQYLKQQRCSHIVLWGGVQATNIRAVQFYEKLGFKKIANFWHDNKDNIDMLLNL